VNNKVLVSGGGGFVGRAVVARLLAEGRAVVATGRTPPQVPAHPNVQGAVAPTDLAGWVSLLTGVDAVVHCAARAHVLRDDALDPLAAFRIANRDLALTVAAAAAEAGVRRLAFLSTIGVLGGETRSRPFRADDPIAPHTDYAVAKAEAEAGLREISARTGLEVVIIRPPLVLGAGAKGNLGLLVGMVRRRLPLPFGLITANRRDLVSLETLADLVDACLDHPHAPGQTFLVSDGAPLSTRTIVERLAELEGLQPRFLPVPAVLLSSGLAVLGRSALRSQLLGNLEVDIAPTRERLGWSPPHPGKG
jgi:nucleoside-diphosphate-sugar epimerase